MLRTDYLRYFLIVAQTASINAAAEQLHITPSAISHSIKNLETQLGLTLFYRSSKGMTLTHDGEVFAEAVAPVLESLQDLENLAQNLAQKNASVTIPTLNSCILFGEASIFDTIVPHFSKLIYQQFPEIDFIIAEQPLEKALQNIADDPTAFAILMMGSDVQKTLEQSTPLTIRTIASHPLAIVGKKNSKLLPPLTNGAITMEQVLRLPLIVSNWNSSSYHTYKHLLESYGTPNIIALSPSNSVIATLIENDKGIAMGLLFSKYSAKLQYIPILLDQDLTINYTFICNHALHPSLADLLFRISYESYLAAVQ